MNASVAVTLLLGLIDRAATVGALISKAQAEGRDVSVTELDQLFLNDDVARDNLDAEIAKARSKSK